MSRTGIGMKEHPIKEQLDIRPENQYQKGYVFDALISTIDIVTFLYERSIISKNKLSFFIVYSETLSG